MTPDEAGLAPATGPLTDHPDGDRKRAVLCIAAGPEQVPVIRAARAAGYAVIAVDRNPDAPGLAEANVRILLSTWESAPIIAALREWSAYYQIVGIANRSSGPPVVTVAEIARALGLPGVPPEMARTVLDKGLLMMFAAEHGILAPRVQTVMAGQTPNEVLLPCVVKPAMSLAGKSGVRHVSRVEDLAEAISWAAASSINGRVSVEERVDGLDISVIGLVRARQLHILAILDEINQVGTDGKVRGLAFAIPSRIAGSPKEAAVRDAAARVVEALELEAGPALVSFRLTPQGAPYLIEVHLDMGGDGILDQLLPASAPDFDPIEWFVGALCGNVGPYGVAFSPRAVVSRRSGPATEGRTFEIWSGDSSTELANRLEAIGKLGQPS